MKISEIQLVSEIQALFAKNNEYNAIKADIAERGIQDPVKVNKHNQLLAGYTRVRIAQELGLDEVPHIVVNIDGDMDAMMEYAILDNIRRRQLTDLQLVEYGVKLENLYKGRQGRPEKGGQNGHVFEGKTRDLVAAQLSEQSGVKMSGKKYERLKMIATKAHPEVKQKFNNGEITQEAVLELVKFDDHTKQKQILEMCVDSQDIVDIRKIRRVIKEDSQKEAGEAITKVPKNLEPPPTGGRKTTTIRWVHRETGEVKYELRIGPNVTSAQLASWRAQKQEKEEYQQRRDAIESLRQEADNLQKEAQQLEARARKLEELAWEEEREIALDIQREIEIEHGSVEPCVETFDIEVLDEELKTQLGKLGRSEAEQIANLLLANWETGKIELLFYGIYGNISAGLSVASKGRGENVSGWTGIGGMDGLRDIDHIAEGNKCL
jgi:hypothetical protein